MIKRKPNRSKKPAPKKPSRSKIVQKLDTVFSLYIRTKHAKNGVCTCCTCGRKFEIKKIQAGHFQSRKHYSTRWDERNVEVQCNACNVFRYGEQYKFSIYLGKELSDELYLKSHQTVKFSNIDLQDMIDVYKEKLINLGKTN